MNINFKSTFAAAAVIAISFLTGCAGPESAPTPEAFLTKALTLAANGDTDAVQALVDPEADKTLGSGYSKTRATSLVKTLSGVKSMGTPVLQKESASQPMYVVDIEYNSGQKVAFMASVKISNGKFYLPM